jgi:hypothetical protein
MPEINFKEDEKGSEKNRAKDQRGSNASALSLERASKDPTAISKAKENKDINARGTQAMPASMFPDSKQMKKKLRENMHVYRYDVMDFYSTEGKIQELARNPVFENVTLAVISFNALWISIDTEYNTADTLDQADLSFILAENFFCFYFTFEICTRFGAFEKKHNCMKDAWFVFDAGMVTLMIAETWIMPLALSGQKLGNSGLLKLLRLLRLSRLARLARLLRSMPELLILIKGMVSAVRSVFFTLILLILLMYVFSILFRQTTDGTDFGREFFPTIIVSMHTLLQYGVFCDSLGTMSFGLAEIDVFPNILMCSWFFFLLLAAMTVMNMLIGVLCEVINAVAISETEEMTITFVRERLLTVVEDCVFDTNEDGEPVISKADFIIIFEKPETADLLQEVEVDVFALVDLVDTLFADEDGSEKKLDFAELVEIMLDHRDSSSCTVNHITGLRKYCHARLDTVADLIEDMVSRDKQQKFKTQAEISTIAEMLEGISGKVAGSFMELTAKREAELIKLYKTSNKSPKAARAAATAAKQALQNVRRQSMAGKAENAEAPEQASDEAAPAAGNASGSKAPGSEEQPAAPTKDDSGDFTSGTGLQNLETSESPEASNDAGDAAPADGDSPSAAAAGDSGGAARSSSSARSIDGSPGAKKKVVKKKPRPDGAAQSAAA